MKLPSTAHTRQPWRIHEFTRDFRLEDVWSFRTPGAGPEDFPEMLAAMLQGGFAPRNLPTRFLFAVRWRLGRLLGWDRDGEGLSTRVRPLRERLPAELAGTAVELPAGSPFTSMYELPDEAAREIANGTVHAVMHLGWAQGANGEYELRMAVLVKPNGPFGRFYMAFIAPFRHLVVYPALTRAWERAWRERDAGLSPRR
ncbi:DUF2867 domain-containing protein [Kitasatospora sp. NPDC051170]|uniref:DUF2867 domain-containing protein n=1 Tax=Kitasatospora sp. NPDC051170 TaxID=3364056 RepID=UPI003794D880